MSSQSAADLNRPTLNSDGTLASLTSLLRGPAVALTGPRQPIAASASRLGTAPNASGGAGTRTRTRRFTSTARVLEKSIAATASARPGQRRGARWCVRGRAPCLAARRNSSQAGQSLRLRLERMCGLSCASSRQLGTRRTHACRAYGRRCSSDGTVQSSDSLI